MGNYLLYFGVATAAIILPGPAVMLTLSNSIQGGVRCSIFGILGVSVGVLILATLSATGLGLILTNSDTAFGVVRYLGASYLIYLGVAAWRKSTKNRYGLAAPVKSRAKLFLEGSVVSTLNPKTILFFVAIFPQFVNPTEEYIHQFLMLCLTFSGLVILIHLGYACVASAARSRLSTEGFDLRLRQCSGVIFVFLGLGFIFF